MDSGIKDLLHTSASWPLQWRIDFLERGDQSEVQVIVKYFNGHRVGIKEKILFCEKKNFLCAQRASMITMWLYISVSYFMI